MNKYFLAAALAAMIAVPADIAPALADARGPSANVAALDTPAAASTARKIELHVEPIEQPAEAAQSEQQPDALPETQPASGPASPAEAVDAAIDGTPESSGPAATADAPVTAKRICRKFSAAIAMVIEVPCESIN